MRTTTLTLISMAFLLPSLPALGWGAAAPCAPQTGQSGGLSVTIRLSPTVCRSVTVVKSITADVEKVGGETPDGKGFNTYMHPFGAQIVTTTTTLTPPSGPPITNTQTQTFGANLFEDCRTCDGNQDAGYQLKIFSKNHDPTKDQNFTKPILVTQGFDASYKLPNQFRYGQFQDILNNVFDKNDTSKKCLDPGCEIGLLTQLYDEGYDIALLLWKNPLIDIRTNARVTLEALRWLQDRTEPNAGTEPVIIGPSMGGLVTRWALQEVGTAIAFPQPGDAIDIRALRARLFIAFDAPNRGAEVPMSLQALASYFRGESEAIGQAFKNLTSPAARQLLLSSVVLDSDLMPRPGFHAVRIGQVILDYEDPDDPRNPTARNHAEFMGEINELGFRAQIKNIVHPFAGTEEPIYMAALINGSGIGVPFFYPSGYGYAFQTGTILDLELGTADPGNLFRVFHGDKASGPGGFLDYDFNEPVFMESVPGGLRDTYRTLINQVACTNALNEFVDFEWMFVDPRFGSRTCEKQLDPHIGNHPFIPSLSGVGLLNVSSINSPRPWFFPVGLRGNCADATAMCMFDEFRAPKANQRHVAITQENKQWFLELIHAYGPREHVQPIGGSTCIVQRGELALPTYRARFGYNNPNPFDVTIPLGPGNRFQGGSGFPFVNQPRTFLSGRHDSVFSVNFRTLSQAPTWSLDGTDAKARAPLFDCPPPPGRPGR